MLDKKRVVKTNTIIYIKTKILFRVNQFLIAKISINSMINQILSFDLCAGRRKKIHARYRQYL